MIEPGNNTSDELLAMRNRIGALSAVKCRMYHEKIAFDSITGLPIESYIPGADFNRVKICCHELRSQRIACAHTNARILLANAIAKLQAEDPLSVEQYNEWLEELNRLDNSINMIDHRKGDLEKELAYLIKEKPDLSSKNANLFEESATQISFKINELENHHCQIVDELEKLLNKAKLKLDLILQKRG